MPQAIEFILTAAEVVADTITVAGSAIVELAAVVGISALLAPKSPTPEALRETSRQAIPPRRRACGVARLGGGYLIDFAQANQLFRVTAHCDRPIEGDVIAYYLSQDQVLLEGGRVVAPSGGYPQACVAIETTFGETGVPTFAELTSFLPTVWPTTSSGTGIFMSYMRCSAPNLKDYPNWYPRGKPILSLVARWGPVFDWRDETQDRADPTTWLVSQNPVVNLVHELWAYRNYDWDTDFAPTLDILTAEADVCDAPVGLLNLLAKVVASAGAGSNTLDIAGPNVPPIGVSMYIGGQIVTVDSATVGPDGDIVVGWSGYGLAASMAVASVVRWQATPLTPVTEPTYACGGGWNVDEAEADTVKRFIDAMDGWMMPRGSDGALVIRAGRYYEPTVIIGADEVISYTWQPYPESGKVVNQLIPSFVCPAYDYNQIDTTQMQDDASIAAYTLSSQPFAPDMVQSNGQVRRLAKRRLRRLLTHVESLTLKASGLRALGERYIRVQIGYGEVEALQDAVLEIVGPPEFGNSGMTVTFQVALADPDIDNWDPYTDEGDGPAATAAPAQPSIVKPTITSVTPFAESSGDGGSGIRLAIEATPPAGFDTRSDLIWYSQWRVVGASSWNTADYPSLDPGDVELDTSFVTANASLEVQVAYQTGAGTLSPFSDTATVSTSTAAIAPGPITLLAATSPSAGHSSVSWRNPSSPNFDHARIYRGTTTTFSAATDVSGALPGASGALETFNQSGLATGTYYYWFAAENAGNVQSTIEGPQSVAVA